MGVDLTLMPTISRESWVSLDVWLLERRRELWLQISDLGRFVVPDPVSCYAGGNFEQVTKTPYGDSLTWLPAGKLCRLSEYPDVQDNWRNRGVWKMLGEMPGGWPVVLYWH